MRITKIQNSICEALKELLREGKPFDMISVQNIVRKAGVSRSSFYNYFNGKEDVAKLIIDVICDAIAGETGSSGDDRPGGEGVRNERSRVLEYCRNNAEDISLLYKAGFGGQYSRTVRERLYEVRSVYGYEFEDQYGNRELLTDGPLYEMKLWSDVNNTVFALELYCEKYPDMTPDDFNRLIEKAGRLKVTGNVIRKQFETF